MIKSGRRFCSGWFDKYNWLEYYVGTNKAKCVVCRLFGERGKRSKAFISQGFDNWRKGDFKFEFYYSIRKTRI